MGAIDFNFRQKGTSVRDAYNKAVEEATFEKGHDSYNGTINTTNGVVDLTNRFKRSGLSLENFIDKELEGRGSVSKWGPAGAICIKQPKTNSNKIKTKVERFPQKGTRKWVTLYVVTDFMDGREVAAEKTQGTAIKKARTYTEKNKRRSVIHIEKRLEKGQSSVARIDYKQSTKEKEGEYVLFGVAAY